MRETASLFAALVAFGITGPAIAQQLSAPATPQPIKRTELQTFEVPGTNYKTVIALVEIVPNVTVGRLTHPGPEAGYVLEGEVTMYVKGQADKLFKAGESYHVPAGAVHDARSGARGVKALMTYVIEKGQPLDSRAD